MGAVGSAIACLKKALTLAAAVAMTCGGAIIVLGVLMQASPTTATPLEPHMQLDVPHVQVTTDNNTLQAYPCSAVSSDGMPWDSCAGLWMFNTPAPFYKWHKCPTRYTVNGATGPGNRINAHRL